MKIREKLETLVKDYVRRRDKFTCQKCDKVVSGSNCQVSHVIPVSATLRLAYDPKNMKVLCYHDHLNWWHKNPVEAGEWFKNKFPDRWAYLQMINSEPTRPIKDFELQKLFEVLKKKFSLHE